ncbi:MAG: hypothetical protein ABUS57_17985, partial [Pseudomonadota bacterium]
MKTAAWFSTFILAVAATVSLAAAQERPDVMISPETAADHRVTFRIKAPKASEAFLSANVSAPALRPAGSTKSEGFPGNWNMPMQKGADGVFSLTLGPLAPDVYRYAFEVDGVRMLDLANRNISAGGAVAWSFVEVPGDPPRYDEVRDVPHGSVQLRTYRVSGT